jgi:hypothetical protein
MSSLSSSYYCAVMNAFHSFSKNCAYLPRRVISAVVHAVHLVVVVHDVRPAHQQVVEIPLSTDVNGRARRVLAFHP